MGTYLRAAVIATSLTLSLYSCASRVSEARGSEDREVLRTVLQEVEGGGQCTACLIESETRAYDPWMSSVDETQRPALPRELLSSYVERNKSLHEVPASVVSRGFRLIPPTERARYFENGPKEGWERLKKAYGERVALLRISLPGYSSAGDTAIVTYTYDYAPLGGETNYVILHRRNGAWKIAETRHLVMS